MSWRVAWSLNSLYKVLRSLLWRGQHWFEGKCRYRGINSFWNNVLIQCHTGKLYSIFWSPTKYHSQLLMTQCVMYSSVWKCVYICISDFSLLWSNSWQFWWVKDVTIWHVVDSVNSRDRYWKLSKLCWTAG